jgi:hypothetical protein
MVKGQMRFALADELARRDIRFRPASRGFCGS